MPDPNQDWFEQNAPPGEKPQERDWFEQNSPDIKPPAKRSWNKIPYWEPDTANMDPKKALMLESAARVLKGAIGAGVGAVGGKGNPLAMIIGALTGAVHPPDTFTDATLNVSMPQLGGKISSTAERALQNKGIITNILAQGGIGAGTTATDIAAHRIANNASGDNPDTYTQGPRAPLSLADAPSIALGGAVPSLVTGASKLYKSSPSVKASQQVETNPWEIKDKVADFDGYKNLESWQAFAKDHPEIISKNYGPKTTRILLSADNPKQLADKVLGMGSFEGKGLTPQELDEFVSSIDSKTGNDALRKGLLEHAYQQSYNPEKGNFHGLKSLDTGNDKDLWEKMTVLHNDPQAGGKMAEYVKSLRNEGDLKGGADAVADYLKKRTAYHIGATVLGGMLGASHGTAGGIAGALGGEAAMIGALKTPDLINKAAKSKSLGPNMQKWLTEGAPKAAIKTGTPLYQEISDYLAR